MKNSTRTIEFAMIEQYNTELICNNKSTDLKLERLFPEMDQWLTNNKQCFQLYITNTVYSYESVIYLIYLSQTCV